MGDDKPDQEEDLTCIHWGYLNVLQLNDIAGKKNKRLSWQTFWTDLCGSTIRLYKDISLPPSSDFPPSTMVGPRPEDQIKHSFFCLKNGSVKDFDYEYYQRTNKKFASVARKNMLQIVLSDSSVYFLQAPTTSALYRWRTKIQSSIDNADAPERHYDKQLREAKMVLFQRQRCSIPAEPTYPEARKPSVQEDEADYFVTPPSDPRVINLKEKLLEKKRLLRQLERQERDFLGTDEENEATIRRIEFSATAKKDYFLVPGRRETLIPAGRMFTVFGRLPNGRWRCFVDKNDGERTSCHETEQDGVTSKEDAKSYPYPLIGCVPTSVITELTQPNSIKDMLDNSSVCSADILSDISLPEFSPHNTPSDSPSARRKTCTSSELNSNQTPSPHLSSQYQSCTDANQSSKRSRPSELIPGGNLPKTYRRVTRSSDSSPLSPTSPLSQPLTPTQTLESTMTDLNQALASLNRLSGRPRVPSGVSTCSWNSTSSQEDDSSDMSRGSRLELVSDDGSAAVDHTGVVRRKKRDIHISRKLHAKGISLIVGSSSSSEDEDEMDEKGKEINKTQEEIEKPSQSKKIEELHASKEKLAEKVVKGPKSTENPIKAPTIDRGNLIDKPTLSNDLLREFSENIYYGLPVRNSVTQTQFKPLSSHEVPPPLHQRRTLQMTRKENEGFGFVLQTYSVVQSGAYNDSMTFVSNVSEDGPAYLAGMRPGDVIMEVENTFVDDYDQRMTVECLKNAGLSVRLVVVYKDAIRLMKLATRLTALKARLNEAETAYDALEIKEKMLKSHVKDQSVVDAKVKVAVVYIYIQTASTTFARDSPQVKSTVVQNKRTPTELLQVRQSPVTEVSRISGRPTTGYEMVREFASSCETGSLERNARATSPRYGSDSALNATKKRKVGESSAKQRTLKQRERSSFISYVDLNEESSSDNSRRRIKSEGNEPEDEFRTAGALVTVEEKPPKRTNLPVPSSVTRPDSYMFAVGTNSIGPHRVEGAPRMDKCDQGC